MLAMNFWTVLIWLALAATALLAGGYWGIDLRLIAAGCVGIAVLSGSRLLASDRPETQQKSPQK